MRPLTLEVLDQALRQCAAWHSEGTDLGVAVNVSAANLLDLALPYDVQALLEKWQVDPAKLQLEITENVIMADPVRASEVIARVRSLGVSLSLDDFGTGYSSLPYLKGLPVDELKIDKSFIFNLDEDREDAAIVRSTIALAHSLGLRVVAEGVESAEVWRQLAAAGCEQAQGFFLGRPMPAEDLESWLRGRSLDVDAVDQRLATAVPRR